MPTKPGYDDLTGLRQFTDKQFETVVSTLGLEKALEVLFWWKYTDSQKDILHEIVWAGLTPEDREERQKKWPWLYGPDGRAIRPK